MTLTTYCIRCGTSLTITVESAREAAEVNGHVICQACAPPHPAPRCRDSREYAFENAKQARGIDALPYNAPQSRKVDSTAGSAATPYRASGAQGWALKEQRAK